MGEEGNLSAGALVREDKGIVIIQDCKIGATVIRVKTDYCTGRRGRIVELDDRYRRVRIYWHTAGPHRLECNFKPRRTWVHVDGIELVQTSESSD